MIDRVIDAVVGRVTRHNVAVVLAVLALTAGMLVGIGNAEIGSDDGGIAGAVDTTVSEKEEYVQRNYRGDSRADGEPRAAFPVFVRDEGGNALSKDALVATLEYQKEVTEDDAVREAMADDEVVSIAALVGARAAQDPDATLEERITALEETDEEEVASLVETTLENDPRLQLLLPESYESGTATAESTQVVFRFEPDEDGEAPLEAQETLYRTADERDDPEFFTLGEPAVGEISQIELTNTLFLVLPIVIVLVLAAAAFAYRDVVDVVVGVLGVIVSIIWMFGILGWADMQVGAAVVIGPVLIAGLSIDYGFHVFTRYREERGEDEPIRPPMARGIREVTVAFALVTATASIGFLSNLVNPVEQLQDLGVAITFGVVSAFVVFVTFVPALKVSIDAGLEWLGLDRHKSPLGDGAVVGRVLSSTVTLARRGAPVVLVVAILLTAGGGVAWTGLDQEPLGGPNPDVAEWKQNLPGPVGWEENEPLKRQEYVSDQFVTAEEGDEHRVQILVEGDVTEDGALAATEAGIDDAFDRGVFAEGQENTVVSPMTVINATARANGEFARTVEEADTDGDGIPDENLAAVFDRLYEISPREASRVIERSDGEYRSLRVIGPPQSLSGFEGSDRANELFAVGDTIEDEHDGLTATVLSDATSEQAAIEVITDGIVRVMFVALGAVFLTLVVVYRWIHDSALLGAVTAAPIASVLAFVVVGMYVLDVPLNFLTALLVSLVVGIGIDYTIHLSDRFAHELDRRAPFDALETAVRGTGGALLGSMLTSVGAFAGMLVHPGSQYQDFATLVLLAMIAAFVIAVVVLPSLLYLWMQYLYAGHPVERSETEGVAAARE